MRGWSPGPQSQGHGRADGGLSEGRGPPQPAPAAPRLHRPRLPHRSGQCGGARYAAAASLARQRGGGGPPEAAPRVRILAGGAGGAGKAAKLGAGSGKGWGAPGGSGTQPVHYLIFLPVACAVPRWVFGLLFWLAAPGRLYPARWGLNGSFRAIGISKVGHETQISAGSAAPVLHGMSQLGDLQSAVRGTHHTHTHSAPSACK